MKKKSIGKAAFGALSGAVIAFALAACFNPISLVEYNSPSHLTDGKKLVDVQLTSGTEGGSARSLSPGLAEKYFNYMEIIFVDTKDTGVVDENSDFYRITGYVGAKLKMAIPIGLYDNDAPLGNKAIMLAGARDLNTGECILLATGVIGTVQEGSATPTPTPAITANTTKVTFTLTALTAAISASPDSAFTIASLNFGTTTISGFPHTYFGIQAADVPGQPKETNAMFTLTGWGVDTANADPMKRENNTQRFLHLVHNPVEEFDLPGIGGNTEEGDGPLASTAEVSWKLTNTPGAMTGSNTGLNITFTSKSTVTDSGMGWLPVFAPVKAFAPYANTQLWQVGSGILRNQLDAGAGTAGAGIVILHGNKVNQTGVGAGPGGSGGSGGSGGTNPGDSLMVSYTNGTPEFIPVSATITLTPTAGKGTIVSVESVNSAGLLTNKLNDGRGNSGKIYIGRYSGTVDLEFTDNQDGTYTLKHRAAVGGYIPIGSYAEFQLINKDAGTLGASYKQEAGLDLLGVETGGAYNASPVSAAGWVPVGKNILTAPFKGTFDGNHKEIRNLYVNATVAGSGLFGYASGGATLKNIRIASGSVTAPQKAGGIVGQAQNVTITRCVNNADISVNSDRTEAYAGGIAGYVTVTTGGVSAIEDCGNTGSIICEDTFKINSKYTGGIAGLINGTTTVSRCFNRGSVTGKGDTGGIAGSIQTGTTIVDISACYNKGEIRTVTSEATVFDNLYKNTGGLAGSTDGTVNITASYSIGTVVGDPKLTSAAGSVNTSFLIGKILGGTTTISYCYYQNRSYRANSGAEYPFPPNEASPTDIDSAYFSSLDWPTTNTPGWNLTDWSSLGNWVAYFDDPLYEDPNIGAGFYSNFPILRWEQPLAWDRELPLPWEGQY